MWGGAKIDLWHSMILLGPNHIGFQSLPSFVCMRGTCPRIWFKVFCGSKRPFGWGVLLEMLDASENEESDSPCPVLYVDPVPNEGGLLNYDKFAKFILFVHVFFSNWLYLGPVPSLHPEVSIPLSIQLPSMVGRSIHICHSPIIFAPSQCNYNLGHWRKHHCAGGVLCSLLDFLWCSMHARCGARDAARFAAEMTAFARAAAYQNTGEAMWRPPCWRQGHGGGGCGEASTCT